MDNAADEAARRARSARFATMPIVLAGTIAVTAGLTGPVAHVQARHDDEGGANKRHVDEDRNESDGPVFTTAVARPAETTVATVAAVTKPPTTYTVRQGDTVSAIAARYGLSAQTSHDDAPAHPASAGIATAARAIMTRTSWARIEASSGALMQEQATCRLGRSGRSHGSPREPTFGDPDGRGRRRGVAEPMARRPRSNGSAC